MRLDVLRPHSTATQSSRRPRPSGLLCGSISSQSVHPTSPTHSSLVPGRNAKRNGLRSPEAMTRRALGSLFEARGLPDAAAPVVGSMRMIVPSSPVGSAVVRKSCERRAPPSRKRQRRRTTDLASRISAGVFRRAVLPVVNRFIEGGAVTSAGVERTVSAERQRPTVWLGNCMHQSSTSTCSAPTHRLPTTRSREMRPLTTQPSSVAPGGDRARVPAGPGGSPSRARPRRPRRRTCTRRRPTALRETAGAAPRPSNPRSQKLCTCVRRSAKTSGDESARSSNTLTSPLFSVTNTRPSGRSATQSARSGR